jgi:hypothetical protein
MPSYLFRIEGAEAYLFEGAVQLAGPEAAREEAVRTAGELLKDSCGGFWKAPEWRLYVKDEAGVTICKVRIDGSLDD